VSRISQESRRVVRSGTQYPAVVVDNHGVTATVKLSNNGAKLSNLRVIGGPVSIGEQVQVDFTTPDPTVVATSKDWLSIEDILRELGKLPEPYQQEASNEWDKLLCFCMDDPKEWEFFSPDANGWYDAQYMIQADFDLLGYSRRWAMGIPPGYRGTSSVGSQAPITHEVWFPQYIYGMGKESVHVLADGLLTCYGVYFENIYFDFWWHEERSYKQESIESYGWAWTITSGSVAGNEIRTPSNDYLFLPDQVFNGQTFRNCKFRHGNGEYLVGGDQDEAYNYSCIQINPWDLDGFYWTRSADDIMIFENCHFIVDPDSCYQPALVNNVSEYDDTYDTHIYLYDCEVDVGDEPVPDYNAGIKLYTVGTKFHDTNILGINAHDILQTSDRATLDHVHGSSGSSGGYDPNAIHDNESGEINMVAEKTQPVMDDILLIEDSEASYAKKKVKLDNIPAPGTERFFISGTVTSGSGVGGAWIAPGYGEIEMVYMHLKTTGATSGSTGIDVNKNGTSIYSSNPKPVMAYNDSDNKDSSAPDTNSFQAGDVFTIDIDSVASGSPTDLTVILAYNLLL
jgi:hypothetical protein